MPTKTERSRRLTDTWGTVVALYLLLLNVVSCLTTFYPYHKPLTPIVVLSLSALVATVEALICRAVRGIRLEKVLLGVLTAMHLTILVADCFLIYQFGFIFNDHTMYILAATDREEMRSFLSAYLTVPMVIGLVAGLALTIWGMWRAARYLSGRPAMAKAYCALAAVGVIGSGVIVTSKILFHNGLGVSLPEMHAFSRVGVACKSIHDRLNEFETLREVNARVTATSAADAPSVVVIVGESFSPFHSSLYGYAKDTNPRLAGRVASGTLTVFTDAASQADFTDGAMMSMFTLKRPGERWWTVPLFPVVFRRAGYHTRCADTQYIVGGGLNSFFYDAGLSALMFDERNTTRFRPDGEVLPTLHATPGKQLVVVHLMGQHYTYADRYPEQFARFQPADYSAVLTPDERQITAHYDNATLYNDYVVDEIIRKFERKDCIVVYLSDHGEEVFEVDHYMGHGNAAFRPDPIYQLQVPFMIWLSDEFVAKRPDTAARIKASTDTPIITDDLPHFLLDVAGVDNDHFLPEHSFINTRYNPAKPRPSQNGLEYNKVKAATRIKSRY